MWCCDKFRQIKYNVFENKKHSLECFVDYVSTEMTAQSKYEKINEAFEDSKIQTLKMAFRGTNS